MRVGGQTTGLHYKNLGLVDMAMTPAERKAAQRARDRANGYVEILVKIRADRVAEMRAHEKRLQQPKRAKK